jgi:hypothetical protein
MASIKLDGEAFVPVDVARLLVWKAAIVVERFGSRQFLERRVGADRDVAGAEAPPLRVP